MNRLEDKWDQSYNREENHIFFPKEDVVKFLARNYKNKNTESLKALDFGCGIGRQTFLLAEFGFDAYGCDISKVALEKAQQLSSKFDFNPKDKFLFIESQRLPFEDKTFECSISDCVLDSMSFENAHSSLKELARVTSGYIFISLIGAKANHTDGKKPGDFIVEDEFEQGTIQSYYNRERIDELLDKSGLKIKDLYSVYTANQSDEIIYERYYITLKSNESIN